MLYKRDVCQVDPRDPPLSEEDVDCVCEKLFAKAFDISRQGAFFLEGIIVHVLLKGTKEQWSKIKNALLHSDTVYYSWLSLDSLLWYTDEEILQLVRKYPGPHGYVEHLWSYFSTEQVEKVVEYVNEYIAGL